MDKPENKSNFYICKSCKGDLKTDPYGNIVCKCGKEEVKRCKDCKNRVGDKIHTCWKCGGKCE